MVTLQVYREYLEQNQLVGSFIDSSEKNDAAKSQKSKKVFLYNPSYRSLPDAQPLSFSLPLIDAPYASGEYGPFFEGLLPEGRLRTELAAHFQIPPSDYLSLLEHLGNECIGALEFRTGGVQEDIEPHYRRISSEILHNLAITPTRTSVDLTAQSRLSLAGAQTKIGVYCPNDIALFNTAEETTLYLPVGTAPSTHILKMPDPELRDLPINELYCMLLAQACDIETAKGSIIYLEPDKPAFITVRYDRVAGSVLETIDDMARPSRLHQEDFCQALGIPSYLKYETQSAYSYPRLVNSLLQRVSTDAIRDKAAFARQVVFDYLIGNCDNHIKNYSLLYSPDWTMRRLAPAYDLVCTTILGYSREMGISIGDTRDIDRIEKRDWLLFAEDLQISASVMKGIITSLTTDYAEQSKRIAERLSQPDTIDTLTEMTLDFEQRAQKLSDVAHSF